LQIELANGGNAQATIRERAGSIEVKIVTPTSAWAQRVSNEIDSMRRNLDSAGIRLGQAEVSYQPGDGGGRGGSGHQRPQQRDISTKDEQIFTLSEVTE
jgi:flagellar hook-length control protein FliK